MHVSSDKDRVQSFISTPDIVVVDIRMYIAIISKCI